MKRMMYKGHEIHAVPYRKLNNKWQVSFYVAKINGTVEIRNYRPDEARETKEEALSRCLDFGRALIDERPGEPRVERKFEKI